MHAFSFISHHWPSTIQYSGHLPGDRCRFCFIVVTFSKFLLCGFTFICISDQLIILKAEKKPSGAANTVQWLRELQTHDMTIKPSSQVNFSVIGQLSCSTSTSETAQNGHFTPLKVDRWPKNSPCQASSCFLYSFSSMHWFSSHLFTLLNDGGLCFKRERERAATHDCLVTSQYSKMTNQHRLHSIMPDNISVLWNAHCEPLALLCNGNVFYDFIIYSFRPPTVPKICYCYGGFGKQWAFELVMAYLIHH